MERTSIRASILLVLIGVAAVGCASRSSQPQKGVRVPRVVVFEGSCDASGAVAIDDHTFVIADDEDNVLRIYDAEKGGPPQRSLDVSPLIFGNSAPEADLEAATQLGDLALWLASHARSQRGTREASRLVFFSTTVPRGGQTFGLVGTAYHHLLDDLIADPRLHAFDLETASKKLPKAEGGLNIEGMTATPAGDVLIGFRNPVPDGLTLMVTIADPRGVFEQGQRARVQEVVRLDLGGRGVRSLSWWHGRYLIAAGNPGDGGQTRLFTWEGAAALPEEIGLDLAAINPEGFFTPESRSEMMILSDDGTNLVDGTPCKHLKDARRKSFRGLWLDADAVEPRG